MAKNKKQEDLVIGHMGSGMSSIWKYMKPIEIPDDVIVCDPKQECCNLQQKLEKGEK